MHAPGPDIRHALTGNLSHVFDGAFCGMEVLVAELGTAFLCADLDLVPEPREDHAAYIENWIEALKLSRVTNAQSSPHRHRHSGPRKACHRRLFTLARKTTVAKTRGLSVEISVDARRGSEY
jgi:antirestriction protein ArdC